MSMPVRVFAAVLALSGLTACAAPPPALQAVPLAELPAGTRWRLADSDVEGLAGGAGQRVRMQVEADSIHGDGSCNRYSARTEWHDGKLQLVGPVSTKRLCAEDERNRAERAFYQALRAVEGARMEDGKLRFLLADGHFLLFEVDPVVAE